MRLSQVTFRIGLINWEIKLRNEEQEREQQKVRQAVVCLVRDKSRMNGIVLQTASKNRLAGVDGRGRHRAIINCGIRRNRRQTNSVQMSLYHLPIYSQINCLSMSSSP